MGIWKLWNLEGIKQRICQSSLQEDQNLKCFSLFHIYFMNYFLVRERATWILKKMVCRSITINCNRELQDYLNLHLLPRNEGQFVLCKKFKNKHFLSSESALKIWVHHSSFCKNVKGCLVQNVYIYIYTHKPARHGSHLQTRGFFPHLMLHLNKDFLQFHGNSG